MAELHPLGTVIQMGARRFVVVGHRMTRDDEHVGAGYVVVPYPLGFVDAESLAVIPARKAGVVVAEGYAHEAGDAYLAEFEELARAQAEIPYEAYAHQVALLQGMAREGWAQEGGADA